MSMKKYTELSQDFFKNILTPEDMQIINNTVENPALSKSIRAIADYSKTVVSNNITTAVVNAFRDMGITCFGTTVRDCQTKIAEFLDYNPECRDIDARKCLHKILYKITYAYHNPNQQNQPVQNQPAIGFTFG